MSSDSFYIFLSDIFRRYSEISTETTGFYIFHSSSTQAVFETTLLENGFEIKNQLIWKKPSAAL
jgi:DNA modification methylase